MTRERPPRLPGLDAVKGVGILLVVLIHAAPEAREGYDRHFVNGVARLAVPAFLLVTGFLSGIKQSGPDKLAGYFRTFLRLHLVYGLFYWGVSLLRNGLPDSLTAKSVVLHFGVASYAGQFYLAILVQLFLVAAFLLPARFWERGSAVLLAAAAAVAGIGWLYLLFGLPDLAAGLPDPLPVLLGFQSGIWLWLYYFALGGWLGHRARTGGGVAPAWTPLLLGAALLLAALDLPTLPGWEEDLALRPYTRPSILLASTLLAFALPALARRDAPGPLRRLGVESFGVFVLNPALLLALSDLLGRPATLGSSWLYVAAAVAAAVPLTRLARRWLPFMVP